MIAGLELGRYRADEAKKLLSKLGPLSKDKQEKIDGLLTNLEVEEIWSGLRSQAQAIEAGRKFLVMEQNGRVPTGRTGMNFYVAILAAHEADANVEGFEKALVTFRELVRGEPRAARMLERMEATLEKLKGR